MITDYPICGSGNGGFGFTVLGSGSQGNATVIHSPDGMLLLETRILGLLAGKKKAVRR